MRRKNRRQEQESSVFKMARGNNGEQNESKSLGNQNIIFFLNKCSLQYLKFSKKILFCL